MAGNRAAESHCAEMPLFTVSFCPGRAKLPSSGKTVSLFENLGPKRFIAKNSLIKGITA